MASGNYNIALTIFIFIMVILPSSGAPVTPMDSQVIVCQPWVLCGTVAFNPEKDQCCKDGSVRSLSRLCGTTMFDPCFQYCCPESYKKEYNVVNKTKGDDRLSKCQTPVRS